VATDTLAALEARVKLRTERELAAVVEATKAKTRSGAGKASKT
jgi:hypothetical protein